MDNKVLGVIELEPKRKFYDYEAKYNSNAKTKHLIPVDLSKNNLAKIGGIARVAHKIIDCKGVTRSDFKFFNGKFYLLEINTQPGMTKLSLVPEIAKHKGISFIKLIEKKLKFPVVAKPINEGSSVHVYICEKTNIIKNLNALRGYNEI